MKRVIQRIKKSPITIGIPKGYLTQLVNKQCPSVQGDRMNRGHLHVSDLLDFCHRQHYLSVMTRIPKRDSLRPGHYVMFAIGKTIEDLIQRSIIEGSGFKDILGTWSCDCGKTKHVGVYSPTLSCDQCKKFLTNYNEIELHNDEYWVVGRPDLVLRFNNQFTVVEIKSMTVKYFESLEQPLINHIYQAASYRRLLSLAGYPVTNQIIFMYVQKEFTFKNPIKEFIVDVSPQVERMIDTLLEDGKRMKGMFDREELPERLGACTSEDSPMAKKCPLSAVCFKEN